MSIAHQMENALREIIEHSGFRNWIAQVNQASKSGDQAGFLKLMSIEDLQGAGVSLPQGYNWAFQVKAQGTPSSAQGWAASNPTTSGLLPTEAIPGHSSLSPTSLGSVEPIGPPSTGPTFPPPPPGIIRRMEDPHLGADLSSLASFAGSPDIYDLVKVLETEIGSEDSSILSDLELDASTIAQTTTTTTTTTTGAYCTVIKYKDTEITFGCTSTTTTTSTFRPKE